MHHWTPTPPDLQAAAEALRSGQLVAFPTETVYGLGANAWDEVAVRRIFAAKGRPADNPLIVHVPGSQCLAGVVANPAALPATVRRAMALFWPGPLTLLLPADARLAPSTHPQLPTVGVRAPSHPVARALLELARCPVAAPSANRSGRPSPTLAADVMADLGAVIDGIIDGGPCDIGVESTVAAIGPQGATIYRPGGISAQELADALDITVAYDAHLLNSAVAPLAPGMKYRHYAPDAQVTVFVGHPARVEAAILGLSRDPAATPVAIIAPRPLRPASPLDWSPRAGEDYAVALSREAYRLLRAFDRAGARTIAVAGLDVAAVGEHTANGAAGVTEPAVGTGADSGSQSRCSRGLAVAIMNRLEKAASGRVIRV